MRERKNVVQSHIAAVDARWGLLVVVSCCVVVVPASFTGLFFSYYLQIEAIIRANSQTLGTPLRRWSHVKNPGMAMILRRL